MRQQESQVRGGGSHGTHLQPAGYGRFTPPSVSIARPERTSAPAPAAIATSSAFGPQPFTFGFLPGSTQVAGSVRSSIGTIESQR